MNSKASILHSRSVLANVLECKSQMLVPKVVIYQHIRHRFIISSVIYYSELRIPATIISLV